MAKKITALGIMNGTSLDGVDYAIIEVSDDLKKITFKDHCHKPLPKKLQTRLLLAATDQATTYEVSQLNFELGQVYKKHLQSLAKTWKWHIIGLHGQTIHHEGKKTTFQIGQPTPLWDVKKTPVYFDFRSADVAAGGHGAPFAPFFQKAIAPKTPTPIAFHNLGGISNLTLINKKQISAFDTGPANILIDAWMSEQTNRSFDRNGNLARKGLPDPLIVNQFLKFPFFRKKPPKSTGREEFNLDFIKKQGGRSFTKLSLNDQLATLTELTAMSISQCYKAMKSQPKVIYFYGGGIYNSFLMSRIQFWLPQTEIKTTDSLGWPTQAFEASTFAYLAAARHLKIKVHDPRVTGAKHQVSLGSVYF